MNIIGNTVLITGGASGIGLAIAEEFLKAGNDVIICGRRTDKLMEAKHKFPNIHFRPCDLTKQEERRSLYEWAVKSFKELNVLVNNAGIQRVIRFKNGASEFSKAENEIATNLTAPVELSLLFVPHLMDKKESAIINITSGLGFIPIAIMPVYCATKAAMHSFSVSLRHQLRDTSVKVFEIIPPTVDTELDQGERAKRGQTDRGIKPDFVGEETLKALKMDKFEYAVGAAENLRIGSRKSFDEIFESMNRW